MGFGQYHVEDGEPPSEEEENVPAEQQRLNEEDGDIEMQKVGVDNKPTRPRILVIGESKPMFETPHLKYALLTFNIILFLFGLAILILAVWIRSDPEFWEYGQSLDLKKFYTVSHLLIVAGIIVLFIGFFGCLGVVLESQWMLITYFIIFLTMFILQLAAVILIWSAPYSKTIQEELEHQMKKQLKVDRDDASRFFFDFVQDRLDCCGAVSQEDYVLFIPKSCKNPNDGTVYQQGCAHAMLQYLRQKSLIVGSVAIPMLLFQLLAKVICACLLYNIRNESRYKMRD